MSFRVQLLTFDSALPGNSSHLFGDGFRRAYIEPKLVSSEWIYFSDPDDTMITIRPDTTQIQREGQSLLVDHMIGGTLVPAGTTLTFYNRTRITAYGDDGRTYYYYAYEPRTPALNVAGSVIGARRHTMIVVPDPERSPAAPPFDPLTMAITTARADAGNSLTQAVAHADIPPEYLAVPCFVAGTLIDTASGSRAVETLRPGDLVMTRDHGARVVNWVGGRHLSAAALDLRPNLRPVRIKAGALGHGLPTRDLLLSPQHRVLVCSRIAERVSGAGEALVAACHLAGRAGIAAETPENGVSYHHILLRKHELVRSEGCWSETLYCGPEAIKTLTPSARRELSALFPEFFAPGADCPAPARPFMSGRQARELVRRHDKHQKPLLEDA